MALGERIRQRRKEKQITAAGLARQAGISKSYLSAIEKGAPTPRPSAEMLYHLATVLGTTVEDLLEKEVGPTSRAIPPSLREYAGEANLPELDVKMLAQIRFRGDQPKTAEDWRFMYNAIVRSIVSSIR